MPKKADIFVSTVFVLDECVELPDQKVKALADTLRGHYSNYEVVIIDNGLRLKPFELLKKLLASTPCLRIIKLSRNHDIDTAIFAGVDAAIGDYVCILHENDPIDLVPKFIEKNLSSDIVFGVARNLKRRSVFEGLGAKVFYWYNRKFLHIDIPDHSTFFICMNRLAANALTGSGRYTRHIRHMAKQAGFNSVNYTYRLPEKDRVYMPQRSRSSVMRAVDVISNYSHHPLRFVSYLGIFAGLLNILYAIYVVIINLSSHDVAKGWTTLSLQSSLMFFLLFMVMAVLAEYIGRILEESRNEPPYHIAQELGSTVSIADTTRRNVTK